MSSNVQPVVIWTVFKTLVPADGSRNDPVKKKNFIQKGRAWTRHFHSLSRSLSQLGDLYKFRQMTNDAGINSSNNYRLVRPLVRRL